MKIHGCYRPDGREQMKSERERQGGEERDRQGEIETDRRRGCSRARSGPSLLYGPVACARRPA